MFSTQGCAQVSTDLSPISRIYWHLSLNSSLSGFCYLLHIGVHSADGVSVSVQWDRNHAWLYRPHAGLLQHQQLQTRHCAQQYTLRPGAAYMQVHMETQNHTKTFFNHSNHNHIVSSSHISAGIKIIGIPLGPLSRISSLSSTGLCSLLDSPLSSFSRSVPQSRRVKESFLKGNDVGL